MTTVTERRIVREISEEETRPSLSIEHADTTNANEAIENEKNALENVSPTDEADGLHTTSSSFDNDNTNKSSQNPPQNSPETFNNQPPLPPRESSNDPSELSLTFKLGNVPLTTTLKPNSAVRQLFPDPRFISPPPAPTKGVISSFDQSTDSDSSEAQKFLITTESLRLFDAVKRSKMSGSRSDSSESESSSIKRTIQRNALRRSLICKYETSSRKKNLRSKDLTLEERIRQLTCVDQDDDNTNSSASETSVPQTTTTMTTTTAPDNDQEFPVRTSPSGEERPNKNDPRICSSRISTNTNNIQETTTMTTLLQQTSSNAHHHHHHHHHQSTYKRITDLFAQKKLVDPTNLPDIGLGDKATLAKEYSAKSVSKMNTDARKQFLASLAPLSCVASTGVDSREDYYQLSAKQMTSNSSSSSGSAPGNRDSIGYNSDSSYSLEDIEAALRGEERNYKNAGGPPDVTRGTPTGSGPETGDATTDELLAFVEQDKSRTERIRRRYSEIEQDTNPLPSCHCNEDSSFSTSGVAAGGLLTTVTDHASGNTNEISSKTSEDDEDDELNDYGFNRRPSVQGVKPQFESTSEIVRQLRSRSAVPAAIAEKTRASFHGQPTWPYYEIAADTNLEKQQASTTFLLAGPVLPIDDDDQRSVNSDGQHRDHHTINRINTMQKQIDDIYQTIAETSAVTVQQGTLERGSYLESTLPRTLPRGAINDSCHRYSQQELTQKNGAVHYHDQHQVQIPGGRMLRIAGGGDGSPGSAIAYNTLPTKSRRAVAISNYSCPVPTIPNQQVTGETKCYRTMYFVPYNGVTDPTYQNIQRILPPHSSANYADHIERYPYPRNGRIVEETTLVQQHPQTHQMAPQQQPRYYARTVPGVPVGISGNGTSNMQPAALHLHLHAQPDDYRFSGTPTTMQQQHSMHHQMGSYNNGQTYTVLAQNRGNGSGYSTYGSRDGGNRAAADVQTQTISISPNSAAVTTTCGSAMVNVNYNNGTVGQHGSSSSSNSSVLSSPTKNQQLRNSSCNVAERGVPEGAASAPSLDYSQNGTGVLTLNTLSGSFIGHQNNVPPPNTQNSVYYAMNV